MELWGGITGGQIGSAEGLWLGGRVGSGVGFATGLGYTVYACYR
ncbi:hypothetical protein [Bartonella pachyuromydis]